MNVGESRGWQHFGAGLGRREAQKESGGRCRVGQACRVRAEACWPWERSGHWLPPFTLRPGHLASPFRPSRSAAARRIAPTKNAVPIKNSSTTARRYTIDRRQGHLCVTWRYVVLSGMIWRSKTTDRRPETVDPGKSQPNAERRNPGLNPRSWAWMNGVVKFPGPTLRGTEPATEIFSG